MHISKANFLQIEEFLAVQKIFWNFVVIYLFSKSIVAIIFSKPKIKKIVTGFYIL